MDVIGDTDVELSATNDEHPLVVDGCGGTGGDGEADEEDEAPSRKSLGRSEPEDGPEQLMTPSRGVCARGRRRALVAAEVAWLP